MTVNGDAAVEAFLERLADRAASVAAYGRGLSPRFERAARAFAHASVIGSSPTLDVIRTCAASLPRVTAAAWAPRSVARRLSAVRSFLSYLVADGRRSRRMRPCTCRRRSPRGGCLRRSMPIKLRACLRISGDDALTLRDRAILELFYSSGLRLAELVGLDLRRRRRRRPHGPRDGQRRQDADRARRPACASRRRRAGSRCAASSRRPSELALFVSRRGERLGSAQRAGAAQSLGATPRRADARASAHAAAFVRDAPARVERRSARGAGAARSCEPLDDAGLYASRLPASRSHLRSSPSRARRRAATEASARFGAARTIRVHDSFTATTIVCVRRDGRVALGGDGQVTLGDKVVKGNARKVRRLAQRQGAGGLRGRRGRCVHVVRLLRDQARAVRQSHARRDRAREGLADGPHAAASRGAALRGRRDAVAADLGDRRRDRARARRPRDRLGRRLRASGGAARCCENTELDARAIVEQGARASRREICIYTNREITIEEL